MIREDKIIKLREDVDLDLNRLRAVAKRSKDFLQRQHDELFNQI